MNDYKESQNPFRRKLLVLGKCVFALSLRPPVLVTAPTTPCRGAMATRPSPQRSSAERSSAGALPSTYATSHGILTVGPEQISASQHGRCMGDTGFQIETVHLLPADNNNVGGCDWDGGDCCGAKANIKYCKSVLLIGFWLV